MARLHLEHWLGVDHGASLSVREAQARASRHPLHHFDFDSVLIAFPQSAHGLGGRTTRGDRRAGRGPLVAALR